MFAQRPHYTYNAWLRRFPSIQDIGNLKKLVTQGYLAEARLHFPSSVPLLLTLKHNFYFDSLAA
jgi:hypothetical protein